MCIRDRMDDRDRAMLEEFKGTAARVTDAIEHYRFREALFEVIDLARKGNKYMQDKEPWILARTLADRPEDQQLIDNCMHICLQLCANLSILINPFLPTTARKLLHMMKVVERMLDWENAGKSKLLSVGYTLRAPELLFRKIEDEEVAAQIQKLNAGKITSPAVPEPAAQSSEASATPAPEAAEQAVITVKDEIVFDDFAKIDLKTGRIVAAEKVPKADKLLKLEVDLGFEVRTIVSGIALHFQPEEIIGRQVVVVVNLAPRKMRGVESRGMILMAEDAAGKLHFVAPTDQIDAGSGVS
jgi:methionyl-tRNA synthetase